jgi:hypothetical protein
MALYDTFLGDAVVPRRVVVNVHLKTTEAATAANYGLFFIADAPYELVSVRERHEVLGTDGGAVTLMVKKVPSGTAKASGTDMLSAGLNLKSVINTNQSGALTATVANKRLAAGDALALVPTGVLTAVAGLCLQVELKRIA